MKKKLFYSIIFLLLGFVIYSQINFKDQKNQLKVLTYSSFAGVHGPGIDIKKEFESICNCELQWFLAEDSTFLLQRFLLLPDIDIVIGWDQITLPLNQKKLWEDISIFKKFLSKKESFLSSQFFIPLDWSPIGFIYKENKYKITSLKSLTSFKAKVSFPEPRTSSLGLQFYYWIYEVFGGDKLLISEFLKSFKSRIYGPVFSWSLAYGFFRKGQTQMSLSYLSSLLYHQKEEPDQDYFFADFQEGHPYQVEFFSVSKKSKNKELVLKFSEFLLSKKAQKIILEKHYMFPVSVKLSAPSILKLKDIKLISYKRLNEFIADKQNLLELWKENLN
ncbi:MAG: thiamine ABC transporter substrate-binding protein [Bdellovibrionaceae bacterium]|nr:thiamine ABC transporter substrate-binding protein [Pseudobdellovibrionaceae bacterium]